jgi:hypothetical protein
LEFLRCFSIENIRLVWIELSELVYWHVGELMKIAYDMSISGFQLNFISYALKDSLWKQLIAILTFVIKIVYT